MRSSLSLPRSSEPVRHDGWPNSVPPLADHTAAYLAAQMRRADEMAEAARTRRLGEAGIGSDPGRLVIEGMPRAVWAGLVRRVARRWGAQWGSTRPRTGVPTAPGLVHR